MDPQSIYPDKPLKGRSLLTLGKFQYQEIFTFLEPLDLLKVSLLCKRFSDKLPDPRYSKIDYEPVWKELCLSQLTFCQKYFDDSWKMTFQRCYFNLRHVLAAKKDFNFKAMTIRHFANFVELLESYHNFIFATDGITNQLSIFLVDEKDLENDEDSLQSWDLFTQGHITYMKYLPALQELVCITKSPAQIVQYKILQTTRSTFKVDDPKVTNLEGFSTEGTPYLYTQLLEERYVVACTFPLDQDTFKGDPQVYVYDAKTKKVVFDLNLGDDLHRFGYHEDFFGRTFTAMQNYFGLSYVGSKMDLAKHVINRRNLAFSKGDTILIPLYSNAYLRIDLSASFAQIQKRGGVNYCLENPYRLEVDGRIDLDAAIEMLPTANILVAGQEKAMRVLSLNGLTLNVMNFNLREGLELLTKIDLTSYLPKNNFSDPPHLLHLGKTSMGEETFGIDMLTSKQHCEIMALTLDSGKVGIWKNYFKETVYSMALGKQPPTVTRSGGQLFTYATQGVSLQVFNMASLKEKVNEVKKEVRAFETKPLFHLNVGSKAMQYQTEKKDNQMYPGRQRGVSNVNLSFSKIACSIDHVIRVYSFDTTPDSDDDDY